MTITIEAPGANPAATTAKRTTSPATRTPARRFSPATNPTIEYVGVFRRQVFANSDGFKIIKLEDGTTVKLNDLQNLLTTGITYRFSGYWKENPNPQYGGRDFHAQHFTMDKPTNERGIIGFLSKMCTNIGPFVARQIYEKFGTDSVEVVRNSPDKIAAANILEYQKALEASECLKNKDGMEQTKIALNEVLNGFGFGSAAIDTCIKLWGVTAPEIIRHDPFKLMVARVRGAGYSRCDKLYLSLGLSPTRLKRQMLAAWYKLKTNRDGHTWVSEAHLGVINERAMKLGLRSRWIAERTDELGRRWYADGQKARDEAAIAKHIKRLKSWKMVADDLSTALWPKIEDIEGLSDHQRTTLGPLLQSPISILGGKPGTGKAQPLTAKILTPTGWKLMGDIAVGDDIINSQGGTSKVIGVFPQGIKEVYRVTFNDGASTECCNDHLWMTATRRERKNAQVNGISLFQLAKIRSLNDIRETIFSDDGHANHYIPLAKPAEFQESCLPLDPYLLGLLLGDGGFTSARIIFSKNDQELVETIRSLIPNGHSIESIPKTKCDYVIKANSGRNIVKQHLENLGLFGKKSEAKFIPNCYKFASVASRIALLQGLLDTDGGVTDLYNVEFSSSSKQLACDVSELIQSLGGKANIKSRIPVYSYLGEKKQGQRNYRMCVSLPASIAPFRLSRKAKAYTPRTKYQPYRVIKSIEYVGGKECQCVAVDAPDHLYVTDDYILTHNTFTIAKLIKAAVAYHGSDSVGACAPTGKAARRLQENISANGVHIEARTIHSLFKLSVQAEEDDGNDEVESIAEPDTPNASGGIDDDKGPTIPRILFIDEVSMLDASVAARLLSKLPTGTHVILIGDVNQLAPVGHGSPLRDLLKSKVIPTGELTEIRRNSGAIVTACHQIAGGEDFDVSAKYNAETGDNLRAIYSTDSNDTLAGVVRIHELLPGYGFDPVNDTQVIAALNIKGTCSKLKINGVLQDVLNASGKKVDGKRFRVRDKVIYTKNMELAEVAPEGKNIAARELPDSYFNNGCKSRVANGDIGRVVAIDEKATIVRFEASQRVVRLTRDTECFLDLAYAVSCHKFQGSESPVVIVVLDPAASTVCCREWVYTAISRAKKFCIIVGQAGLAERFCQRVSIDRRKTFLVQLLKDGGTAHGTSS